LSVKESGKKEREILKIMRKNSHINSFYYFNEVLDFNWFGVKMMCWVRVLVRISHKIKSVGKRKWTQEIIVVPLIT